MKLIVMRHGEAEGYTAAGDAQRRLTQRGLDYAMRAGGVLQQCIEQVEQLWVSPYVRARQTADQVQLSLPATERQQVDGLTPESSVDALLAAIGNCAADSLMLVSHQPLVGALIARLAGVSEFEGPMMAPASMVLLEADAPLPGCFDITWQRHGPDFHVL